MAARGRWLVALTAKEVLRQPTGPRASALAPVGPSPIPTPMVHRPRQCLCSTKIFPGPVYWGCSVLPGARDPLENEFYVGQSFSALGVLHFVEQAGAKAAAEAIWAPFTRLTRQAFRPATPWQFCLVRSPIGRTAEVILRLQGSWSEILRDALDPALPGVSRRLADDPLMLLLFVIVCAPDHSGGPALPEPKAGNGASRPAI